MADFDEIVDQFSTLVEGIRQDPAQLLERGEVDRFKDIALHTITRTDAQKGFARGLEEEFFISKRLELVDRQRTVSAKLRTDLSEDAETAAQAELDILDELIRRNDQSLDSIDEQVQAYGLAVGKVIELNEFERRRAELALEIKEIKISMVGLTGEELALQHERIEALKTEQGLAETQEQSAKDISSRSALRNKQEEIFGFSVEGANQKIRETGELLDTTAGTIALIAAAAKILFTPAVKQMTELRDLGLSWKQTITSTTDIINTAMDRGLVRGLLTLQSSAEATAAMRGNFADLSFQSQELAAVAGELVTSFKLSANEAAQLVEAFTKVGGLSEDTQDNILHMAAAFGEVNDIRPDALIRAMAQHAGVFARFGEEGSQAFLRSVAAAEKLGIELSAIESSADQFLNIDTFFQDVSKLRTLGLDIQDPFGLAQIAETGTPQELVAELQRQLQGIDLTQLSRTRRNALSQAIGMDQDQLARIIRGEDVGDIGDVTEAQIQELGGFNEGMGGAVDAILGAVGSLDGISGILGKLVDLLIIRAAVGGAGSLLGGLGLGGAATAVAGGLSTAATVVGGGVATAATATGAALLTPAAIVAAVGGTAIIGGLILNEQRKIRRDEASGAAFDVTLAESESKNAAIHAAQDFARENPGITAADLVQAMLGMNFNIDGRTAGRLIAAAQGPANR